MKYQIGDKVLILHSNEEADVVDIINDEMLLVSVEGITFPVYMDQVDHPYFKRFTEQKSVPPKKEKKFIDQVKTELVKDSTREENGVWLTYLPVLEIEENGDVLVKELKLHLINHTNLQYQFVYALHFFGKTDFELKNTVQPFEDFYLHDLRFEDLNDSPSFEFEFHLSIPDKSKEDYFNTVVKLKPKQFFNKINELKKKNQATFSQLIFEKYPNKKIELSVEVSDKVRNGQSFFNVSEIRQHIESPKSVIDLHIEKLTNDSSRMSNFEMLTLQLKYFEKYYHLAVINHQPSLIVIHGIGSGKLKEEIHMLLTEKLENITIKNEFHPKYGYGATEIYFKY